MRDVVVRCINEVANIWCDLNVAWGTWNVALLMWYISNTKGGTMRVMHNVADVVRFEIWYCKME